MAALFVIEAADAIAATSDEHVSSAPAAREDARQRAFSLLEEGREHCNAQRFHEALHAFTSSLTFCEAVGVSVHAAALHNVGHCLQSLGEFSAARPYYERALALFVRSSPPRWTVGSDVHDSRCAFIKERLVEVMFNRLPTREYLDEWGRKRPLSDELGSAIDTDGQATRTAAVVLAPQATMAVEQPQNEESPVWPAHGSMAEMEVSRREWLQYHMRCCHWEEAAALVVTADENEKLVLQLERERARARPSLPLPVDDLDAHT